MQAYVGRYEVEIVTAERRITWINGGVGYDERELPRLMEKIRRDKRILEYKIIDKWQAAEDAEQAAKAAEAEQAAEQAKAARQADAEAAQRRARQDAAADKEKSRRYWMVKFEKVGFRYVLFVYGTVYEMQAYMDYEIGGADARHSGNYSYSGASDAELAAAEVLGLPRYIAPQL